MSCIQLLPENGEESIEVSDTPTVIGRGPFLKVIDKRVSRNHALLEVIDGKLHLKPTHSNPCFFRAGGKGTQQVLKKDVLKPLEEGDMFGLLPDQLFYTVSYSGASVNGIKRDGETKKSAAKKESERSTPAKKAEKSYKHSEKENNKERDTKPVKHEKVSFRDIVWADGKNMAMPLTKKRTLPAWMIRLVNTTPTPAARKQTAPAKTASPAKRAAPSKPAPKKKSADDDFFDDEDDDGDEDERPPRKKRRPASDDDYEEEPQKKRRKAVTQKPRRRREASDEDEDFGARKKRGAKVSRSSRGQHDSEEESSPRRPRRAATKTVGSYEEDFPVDDEFDLGDGGGQGRRDSDSDFHVGANDSGSDWEKRRGSPKKPAKKPAGRTPARGGRGKRKPLQSSEFEDENDFEDSGDEYIPRPSKRRGGAASKTTDSEEEDEEEMEEIKVKKKTTPKKTPAKSPAKKKKTSCYYGSKCYRKNLDHFKQFSHPGDSDEEEKEEEEAVEKTKDRKRGQSKMSKPEASKAPVTKKKRTKSDDNDDDDGLPNTYDYNDSFIDDGMSRSLSQSQSQSQSQRTGGGRSEEEDEDLDELEDEAKAFMKNRKMRKPVVD